MYVCVCVCVCVCVHMCSCRQVCCLHGIVWKKLVLFFFCNVWTGMRFGLYHLNVIMVFPLPTGTISVLQGIFSGFLLVLHQYIFCFFPKQLFENSCVIYTCTLSFCTVHYFYECTEKIILNKKKKSCLLCES